MTRMVAWLAVLGVWVLRATFAFETPPPLPSLRVVSMPRGAIPAPLYVGQTHSFVPTPGQAASIRSALAEAALGE